MEREEQEKHRFSGAVGSLKSTYIKAGEIQDLWWWGGENEAYIICVVARGKMGQGRKDGQSL